MKKSIRKIFLIILIPLFVVCLLLWILFSGKEAPISYDKNIILSNKDAYTLVAETLYNDFKTSKGDNEFLTYSPWAKQVAGSSNKRAFCLTTEEYFDINEEQAEAFNIVVNTYKLDDYDNGIDRIYVKDNFVFFENERGQTAFIYSVNEKKPSVYAPRNTEEKAYVEKICDHWYYACRKNVILN